MEKLQSTFKNMVLSLVIICFVAASALAGIYILTFDTIEQQKQQKQQAAILAVLPAGCTISDAEQVNGMTVYKGYINGQWVGTAVETTENGFGGPIKIMVGFDADSMVINYQVLEHQETPGLGDKMGTWFKTDKGNQNIVGKKANGTFQVSKDGGDVDAITAATISSRAFLHAINQAFSAFTNGKVEAISGATQQAQCEKQCDKAECEKQCDKAECEKTGCDKTNCKKVKEMEVSNE